MKQKKSIGVFISFGFNKHKPKTEHEIYNLLSKSADSCGLLLLLLLLRF